MAGISQESTNIAGLILDQLTGRIAAGATVAILPGCKAEARRAVALVIQSMTDKLAAELARRLALSMVPRSLADPVVEALEATLAVLKHTDPAGHPAIVAYRKAVAGV